MHETGAVLPATKFLYPQLLQQQYMVLCKITLNLWTHGTNSVTSKPRDPRLLEADVTAPKTCFIVSSLYYDASFCYIFIFHI